MHHRQSHPRTTFSSAITLLALVAFTWSGTAQAQTFTQGIADNFVAPTEPASPSAGMLSYITSVYSVPGSRPFDDASGDRWFATTFTNLRRNGPICGATLRMTVRNLGSNDSMGFMFMGPGGTPLATGWGDSLPNLGVAFGATGTINLNLAALPGAVNLIPTLNAQGFVDVIVQDDSAVDFVSLTVTQCRVDVYSKDTLSDVGNTPTVDPIWVSPDIRVCQTLGCVGHQNPEFGQPNYVYVTLRNNGPLVPVGNPASGTLLVYYTGSGGAAVWPTDWAPIGSIPVSLAAGATQEFFVPWTTVPAPGHYCLLTRWVSAQDPMTLVELPGSNTLNNTRWNNNLAWKNINVVNLTSFAPSSEFDFRLRNLLRDAPGTAALEVRIPQRTGGPSFLQRGQLILTLPQELWARWQHQGTGFEVVGERQVRIVNPNGARLEGLTLDPDGAHHVGVRFSAQVTDADQGKFEVELVQHSASQENPTKVEEAGGVRFDITVGQPANTQPK
ncbi:hypothetical protein HUW62_09455 [Myxococcus sp. AM011]|uniref:hypothetical protein n=1 Tax=Myxococcus sp. AM011 TaxID=2745200 RepID=UPI0015958AD7|nr:hypothetical protein [Myxococcus sp. AM011]NVJ21440.1 hypothetical protein [Myxococcus sp. AM011]